MKKIILAVIVIGVVLGGITLTREPVEFIAPQVIEKEVEVDALEQAIKTAQEGKQEAIRASAQAAYDAAYEQEMKKVELEVIQEYQTKLDTRQTELEKQTNAY